MSWPSLLRGSSSTLKLEATHRARLIPGSVSPDLLDHHPLQPAQPQNAPTLLPGAPIFPMEVGTELRTSQMHRHVRSLAAPLSYADTGGAASEYAASPAVSRVGAA